MGRKPRVHSQHVLLEVVNTYILLAVVQDIEQLCDYVLVHCKIDGHIALPQLRKTEVFSGEVSLNIGL